MTQPLVDLQQFAGRSSLEPARLIAPWRSWTGALALGGLAYALLYLVVFLTQPAGLRGAQLLSDFGEPPLELIGVVLTIVVVAREPRRRARLAWALFAAAFVSDLAGNIIYGLYDVGGQQPFPSVADAFYLAFYPLMLFGLLALPTASDRRDVFAWRVWSNMAIVILGGGMALMHFFVLPTIGGLGQDPLATVVSLAYPVGDLALVGALASISTRQPFIGDRTALALFIAAVAAWFFGDLGFAMAYGDGPYPPGSISDLIWVAGDLAFVLGVQASLAAMPRPDRYEPAEAVTVVRAGPLLMLGLGLFTLVSAAIGAKPEMGLLAVMAVVLTLLVVSRQIVDEYQRRRTEAALMEAHARAAERAARQARHDPLTGLPNRTWLHELLHAEMAATRLTGRPVTLAFLDLNYFKAINDNLGHAIGDELLVDVARRLEACLREGDTLTRLGGDEFAIVLPGTPSHLALDLAARARAELERPFDLAGTDIAIGGAFGLATYPDCGATDVVGLMHRADTAMYRAKRGHLGPIAYDASFETHGPSASALAELRSAIADDRLLLQFQPIRGHLSGRTEAVEALVRWNSKAGLLLPKDFLPLAVQTGLIRALDTRVLDLACAQARAWRDARLTVRVSVNVSRESLQELAFFDLVHATLDRYGLPGTAIELEVTEDGLLESADQACEFMGSAHELGIRMALDDFGIGFSSLGRLRDLPVDYLKIDQSFVAGTSVGVENAAIVETVVSLAHRLGKHVVAEGVESRATLDYLDEIGADYTQGFFIGRPVGPEEITARLQAEQWSLPRRSTKPVRAAVRRRSEGPAA